MGCFRAVSRTIWHSRRALIPIVGVMLLASGVYSAHADRCRDAVQSFDQPATEQILSYLNFLDEQGKFSETDYQRLYDRLLQDIDRGVPMVPDTWNSLASPDSISAGPGLSIHLGNLKKIASQRAIDERAIVAWIDEKNAQKMQQKVETDEAKEATKDPYYAVIKDALNKMNDYSIVRALEAFSYARRDNWGIGLQYLEGLPEEVIKEIREGHESSIGSQINQTFLKLIIEEHMNSKVAFALAESVFGSDYALSGSYLKVIIDLLDFYLDRVPEVTPDILKSIFLPQEKYGHKRSHVAPQLAPSLLRLIENANDRLLITLAKDFFSKDFPEEFDEAFKRALQRAQGKVLNAYIEVFSNDHMDTDFRKKLVKMIVDKADIDQIPLIAENIFSKAESRDLDVPLRKLIQKSDTKGIGAILRYVFQMNFGEKRFELEDLALSRATRGQIKFLIENGYTYYDDYLMRKKGQKIFAEVLPRVRQRILARNWGGDDPDIDLLAQILSQGDAELVDGILNCNQDIFFQLFVKHNELLQTVIGRKDQKLLLHLKDHMTYPALFDRWGYFGTGRNRELELRYEGSEGSVASWAKALDSNSVAAIAREYIEKSGFLTKGEIQMLAYVLREADNTAVDSLKDLAKRGTFPARVGSYIINWQTRYFKLFFRKALTIKDMARRKVYIEKGLVKYKEWNATLRS